MCFHYQKLKDKWFFYVLDLPCIVLKNMWISRGKHVLSDLVRHGQNWWIWTREIPVVVITGFDWHLCNVFPLAKLKDKWFICIRSAMYCFRRTREFHVESTFYQTLWNMVKTGGFEHVKFPWWTESNTRVHNPACCPHVFSSEKHVPLVNSLFGSTYEKLVKMNTGKSREKLESETVRQLDTCFSRVNVCWVGLPNLRAKELSRITMYSVSLF